MYDQVNRTIEASLPDMLRDIGKIIAVPAMAPSFEGGEGELARSQVVDEILQKSNVFDSIHKYDFPDTTKKDMVIRPNLVARVKGSDPTLPTTWVVTHMDEVPPGDPNQWYSHPRELTLAVEDDNGFRPFFDDPRELIGTPEFDKLVAIGRSIDDDIKPGVGAIYALKALKENGITPNRNIGLVFVSDEETGKSEYGIKPLVEKARIFKPEDLIIVPDFGNDQGSVIETAEKSRLVLKITTEGVQGHSATSYDDSLNASEIASRYQIELIDHFRKSYDLENEIFDPSYSTIQTTQRRVESGSTNMVPGTDISFIDMRILPDYNINDVLECATRIAKEYQDKYGVTIKIKDKVNRNAPPATFSDSEVVTTLIDAVREVRGIEPEIVGVGGGTCASHIREVVINGKHLQAAVYCSITDTEHKVNERAKLSHMLYDTQVFAHVFMK